MKVNTLVYHGVAVCIFQKLICCNLFGTFFYINKCFNVGVRILLDSKCYEYLWNHYKYAFSWNFQIWENRRLKNIETDLESAL